MLRRKTMAEEIEQVNILAGLLKLRKDGHFAAIYVQGDQLRVQYQVDGPILLLGWRRAKEMVRTAEEATARATAGLGPVVRKPPAPERSQRAAAPRTGKTW